MCSSPTLIEVFHVVVENVFLHLVLPWILLWVYKWGWFQMFWWSIYCGHCLKNGREHLKSCKPLAGGSAFLQCLRWNLPVTVTCTCTDSWIFRSPFCLWEVSFTRCILKKSDNWTKSKLKKNGEMIAAGIFSCFHSDQTISRLLHLYITVHSLYVHCTFSEWCFLLMTCSCSQFILLFSSVQCPSPAI